MRILDSDTREGAEPWIALNPSYSPDGSTSYAERTASEYWYIYSPIDIHGAFYNSQPGHVFRFFGSDYANSSGRLYGAVVTDWGQTMGEVEMFYDESLFENILSDVRGLDHTYSFAPVTWTETNSTDYLAGDPNP
jgi:hypothetical protein